MTIRQYLLMFLYAALAGLSGLAGAQVDSLKNDPFVRPVLTQRTASEAAAPAAEWKPELRAIMVAGAQSIVNIEGVILRRGEQFNGYRLLEVHEETAVFVYNKKRVTLSLRGIELPLTPPLSLDDRPALQRGNDSGKPEGK